MRSRKRGQRGEEEARRQEPVSDWHVYHTLESGPSIFARQRLRRVGPLRSWRWHGMDAADARSTKGRFASGQSTETATDARRWQHFYNCPRGSQHLTVRRRNTNCCSSGTASDARGRTRRWKRRRGRRGERLTGQQGEPPMVEGGHARGLRHLHRTGVAGPPCRGTLQRRLVQGAPTCATTSLRDGQLPNAPHILVPSFACEEIRKLRRQVLELRT